MTRPRPLDADFLRHRDAIRELLDDPNRPMIQAATLGVGGIEANRIEAGSIQDPDGMLAALTDQLVADIQAANRLDAAAGSTPGDQR